MRWGTVFIIGRTDRTCEDIPGAAEEKESEAVPHITIVGFSWVCSRSVHCITLCPIFENIDS